MFDCDEDFYMNKSGKVGTYDDWWYTDMSGEEVNAVDTEEMVPVVKDTTGHWIKL